MVFIFNNQPLIVFTDKEMEQATKEAMDFGNNKVEAA